MYKIFLVIIFISPLPLLAAGDAGQPGAFLRAGVGARPAGMGNAFTAQADDATAAYWNPAGLAFITSSQLGSMVALLSLDRKFNFANVAFSLEKGREPVFARETAAFPAAGKLGGWGQWAFSWINFSLGDDFEGRQADTAAFTTFSDQQNAYVLSNGRAVASWLSLGTSVKVLHRTLADFNATGVGVDFGLMALVHRHLRIGVTVNDLASRLSWETGFKEKFPVTTRLGLASPWLNGSLLVLADAEGVDGRQPRYRAGMEGWVLNVVAGRLGINENGFTAGASLHVKVAGLEIQFDYGFTQDPLKIGNIQKFSLLLGF